MKLLLIILGIGLIINPRVVMKSGRANNLISCSTGWSLHWQGLSQKNGMVGLYSLESAAWSELKIEDKRLIGKIKEKITVAKMKSMNACN